jgi:hypothetical protein
VVVPKGVNKGPGLFDWGLGCELRSSSEKLGLCWMTYRPQRTAWSGVGTGALPRAGMSLAFGQGEGSREGIIWVEFGERSVTSTRRIPVSFSRNKLKRRYIGFLT